MSKTIVAEFRLRGTPKTGLSPTILIWQVDVGTNTLVVNGDAMTEVGNGFYKYIFTTGAGFDPREDFVYQADGTSTITNDAERFVSGSVGAPEPEEVADGVWEADNSLYVDVNTMGGRHNATFSNTGQLLLDVAAVAVIVDLTRKHQTNRTKIDVIAKTLTVFDDDGTTPLQVFDLLDSGGVASVNEVCERNPQ